MSNRSTSAAWVKGMAEALAAEGLDVRALFSAAGLEFTSLDIPGAHYSTEKISRLWELAAERSGNPAIGLAQHHVAKPGHFGVVGYTMMSCVDLLAAFERLVRYLRILSDTLTITVRETRDEYRLTFVLFGGERPVPRQRIEFIFATVVSFCRWIAGSEIHPLAVELAYPEPADLRPYEDAFHCRLLFNARHNRLRFSLFDLNRPLPTSNPLLARLHEQFAGRYLARFDHTRTSARAREVIIRRLPDGEPRRDEVASELCMSERTLQRRLHEEETSFLELLDDTRRELAEQYLGRLHLSLGQAAYMLGFADQNSFFHVCKRWFERSPGRYRHRTLNQNGEAVQIAVGNLIVPTRAKP